MNRIRYSADVDTLIIELSDAPVDHAEESGPFILHLSRTGEPVLLEILNAKEFLLGSLTSMVKGTEAALP